MGWIWVSWPKVGKLLKKRILPVNFVRGEHRSRTLILETPHVHLFVDVGSITTRIRVYCNEFFGRNTCQIVAIHTYCHKMEFVGSRCDWTHGNRLLPQNYNCGNTMCYYNNHVSSRHAFPRDNTYLMQQFGLWRYLNATSNESWQLLARGDRYLWQ
jgi:hypothetical protein